MQHAYNEAISAWVADEVPIGAVVVHEKQIIAAAHNQTRTQNDPTAHAEMIAITIAANHIGDWRLNECKLFVTKEPCPMCSGASIMSRIGEVHFSFEDPKMGGLGGAISLHDLELSNHKPKIVKGTMQRSVEHSFKLSFKSKGLEVKRAKLSHSVHNLVKLDLSPICLLNEIN